MNEIIFEFLEARGKIKFLLYATLIKTLHEVQSKFGNLLDFMGNFHQEK